MGFISRLLKSGGVTCRWLRKEDLRLLGIESIITGGLTVIVYALVLVSIYRVFQIGTDVGEMKELLKDIKNNTAPAICRWRAWLRSGIARGAGTRGAFGVL